MQADPEQRYQTAQAMQTDVQSAAQAKPQPRTKAWHWAGLAAVVVGLVPMATIVLPAPVSTTC